MNERVMIQAPALILLFVMIAPVAEVAAGATRSLRLGWLLAGLYAVSVTGILVVRWYRRICAINLVPLELKNASARLQCVCPPEWILRHGEIRDVPFEPVLFRFLHAGNFSPAMKVTAYTTTAAVFLLLAWISSMHGAYEKMSRLLIFPALLAGVAVPLALWPTWMRVTPGRLEVMRFSPLRRERVSIRRYDLRRAWVLIDLRVYGLGVGRHGDGEPEPVDEYPIYGMRRRTEFAHAILMTALSTHEAPPLPEDELLG